MLNLKNQKGSITLFVLVSAMFFIASVVGVNINMQSKEIAVDKEYKQIKNNYEINIDNMESIYQELSQKDNLDEIQVFFDEPSIDKEDNIINISQRFKIDLNKYNVKTLKYGWIYSEKSSEGLQEPTEWIFAELFTTITATKTDKYKQGYYYLCISIVDNSGKEKVIWSDQAAEIN